MLVSIDDYFKCYTNDRNHPAFGKDFRTVAPFSEEYTEEILAAAEDLIIKVNHILSMVPGPREFNLTSGWRPKLYSSQLGLSTRSNHTKGLALDLYDPGNQIYDYLTVNIHLIENKGMAREHKSATPTWLHLQTVLPRSGRTTFYP